MSQKDFRCFMKKALQWALQRIFALKFWGHYKTAENNEGIKTPSKSFEIDPP